MKFRLILPIVLLIGLSLRIAVLISNGYAPRHDLFPGMDEVNYHELAENLRESGVFAAWTGGFLTHSTRSPGYPVLLAGASLVTGKHPWTAQILNFVLDLVNLLLVFLVARRLYGNIAGCAAMSLYALLGPVFLYLPLATPEMMSVTLILLVCFCLLHLRGHYWRISPALGILYALLIHTRPVFLILIPALAICAYLQLLPGKKRMLHAVCPALLALCLCIPWGIRNYRIHRALVPVCTTAGWHLVNRAQAVEDLSVDFLTDYIYAPERSGFAEGDYFREGIEMSRDIFIREPLHVLYFGVLRVVHGWFLPQNFYRFLLPRSYLRPVFVGEKNFIPVPDSEGLLYLAIVLALISAAYLGRSLRRITADWFLESRAIILLLFAYVLAHVIGFPLIQYRFIIEPVLLILGVGLALRYLSALKDRFSGTRRNAEPEAVICEFRWEKGIPLIFSAIFAALILAAICFRGEKRWIHYPDTVEEHGIADYQAARSMQWNDHGRIPEGTKAAFSGIVKYSRPSLYFPPDKAVAIPENDSAVAVLFVNDRDERFAGTPGELGIGDCKLNLRGTMLPQDGDCILVRGILKTGSYKDLIIDVDEWQQIH